MKILVCNVGSTSLKYRLFDLTNGEETLSEGRMERVGTQAGTWMHMDAGAEAAKAALPGIRSRIEAARRDGIKLVQKIPSLWNFC